MITEVSRDVSSICQRNNGDTPLDEAVFLIIPFFIPPFSKLQIANKSDNRQTTTKKATRDKPPPEKAESFSRYSVINHELCISMCGTRGCRRPVPKLHTHPPSGFARVFWPARLRSKALVPQLRIPVLRVRKILNYNLLHLIQSTYYVRTTALNIDLYYI